MTTDHYYCPWCFWTLTELQWLRVSNGSACPGCGKTGLNDFRMITYDPIEHEEDADERDET